MERLAGVLLPCEWLCPAEGASDMPLEKMHKPPPFEPGGFVLSFVEERPGDGWAPK